MSAALALQAARDAGLHVALDGDALAVDAPAQPPADVLDLLTQHKAEIVALLRGGTSDPRAWAEGFAIVSTMPPPTGFSPERWRRILDAAGQFLDEWGEAAISAGWSDLDSWGCDPDRPDARFDCMGLVLLLDRSRVVALDTGGADLRTATGARQRFRRRADAGAGGAAVAARPMKPQGEGLSRSLGRSRQATIASFRQSAPVPALQSARDQC
jgi:hypothetical protein